MIRSAISVLLLGTFIACAAPQRGIQQDFVPRDELSTVEYSEEGLSLMARARYLEATGVFYQALHLYPQVLPLRMNLAIALRELGDLEKSKEILHSVIQPGGYVAPARLALASLLFDEGETEQANEQYDQAIEQENTRNDFAKAAQIALSAAEQNDAIGSVDEALCFAMQARTFADSAPVRSVIGRIYLAQGDYTAAQKLSKEPIGGPKRDQLELKLIEAIAGIALDESNVSLKVLERLELAVRRQPELLPEIQILRIALLIKAGSEQDQISLKDAVTNLSEADLKSFHTAFSSKANEAPQARYWPLEIREILELQDPEHELLG